MPTIQKGIAFAVLINLLTPMAWSQPSSTPDTSEEDATQPTMYTCELQGLTRKVEIAYEAAPSKVPCAVNYYKNADAPEEANVLWSAQNMEGYCEEKAAQFVDKLQSWGWSCS